jgi:hypothetical protein
VLQEGVEVRPQAATGTPYRYGGCQEAMIIATQLPYERFLMLAGCFDRVCVWYKGRHIKYIELLKMQLDGAQYMNMSIPNCVIFY